MRTGIEDLIKLAEIAKKKDRGTRNAIMLSALKPEKAEKVAKILTLSAVPSIIAMQENPFWEIPEEEEIVKGAISVGRVLEGNKLGFDFSLPLELFTEHIGIFGSTGSGKSFLCKFVCSQLLKKKIPVWFFDFEDEYSELYTENPEDFYALEPGNIKINLFQNPPNTRPVEWFEKLMNVLRESLYLRDGSINMIGEILFQQYKMRGVLEGGTNYPGLKDIYRELNKLRFRINSRNAGYWESLNNRFSDLVKLPMFDCRQGLDFPMLMKKPVVFKLGGLSDYHQNLFVNHILTYISSYRERMDDKELLVLLLDEGHRIVNYEKARRADLAEPISFECARNFRKRGVSLILSDQVPSLIPASWMGNLGTRLVLRLSHGGCIKAISDALALGQEQRMFIPELPRRTALVHYLGWSKPFLIQIPELQFERADKRRIREFMEERSRGLRYVPYEEETVIIESKDKEVINEKAKTDKRRGDVLLLKEEMDYLESIVREPFLAVTERDRKLEISGWKGHSLREKLIKKEVIEKVAINTKKRGGVIYLTKVTEKGREIANSLGMGANILRGKGGFTHQFWAYRIKSYFEQTGEAVPSIEDDSLGKAVDVSLIFRDKKVAVEIEINKNESFNISKDLFSGYDEVWICSESEEQIEKSKKRVQDNLGEEIFEKVKFRLLSEFDERARNIIGNIGAQPFGLRAGKEEKAEKEKEVEKKERRVGEKEENVLKNINKKQSHGENDLLTVGEVSLDLGLSLSTVKKWVAKRVLPVIKLGHGKKGLVRVRKKDLDKWVENQLERKKDPLPAKKKALKNRKNESFDEFVKALKSGSPRKSEDSDG
jgi:excisionase family DNA binding protein